MSVEPPILKQSTGRRWRDQTSAWGSRHTVGDSFELDRMGVDSDGPLQTRAGRRAYLLIYGSVTVSLVAAALIFGEEISAATWWNVALILFILGIMARRWRRARLP